MSRTRWPGDTHKKARPDCSGRALQKTARIRPSQVSDLDDPTRRGFDVTGLHAGQFVVQTLGHRTDFSLAVEHVQLAVVLDAADRRDHRGSTAGTGFLEVGDLVDQHIAFDDLQAQARFGQFDQRQTGDTRQDRRRLRRDEFVVVGDTEEVGRTDFLDLRVGQRVQVDAVGEAALLGLGTRHQAGGIVATDLGRTGALRGGAVVAGNHEVVRLHAALEVGADRDAEDREDELGGGTHADVVTHADHERAQVQRTAGAVRRDETFVGADHLLAGFDKYIGRYVRHQQARAAALHARGVLVRTEQVDRTVLATVGLHAFEALLAVVQRGRTFADMQDVVFGQRTVVPLTVAVVRQVALVGLDVIETQLVPVNAFLTHGTLNHLITA